MRTTLASYLDDFARLGEEEALAHRRGLRTERWSYRRWTEAAHCFAHELDERGIAKGDRILLWAESSSWWAAAFFGSLVRGVVVVPLDPQSHPDFVRRIQDQVRARWLVRGSETSPPGVVDDLPASSIEGLPAQLERHAGKPAVCAELSGDDLVEIVFTSGTTADPKGIRLTHANLLANLNPLEHEIRKYLRWERWVHPIRFLCSLPLSHVFGQMMGLFVPPLLRGSVFFENALNPSEIARDIRRERVSVMAAVPRVLEILQEKVLRDLNAGGSDLAARLSAAQTQHFVRRWWTFREVHRRFGWKFWAFVSGGATLDADVESFWNSLGYAVVQGYGMTETAALITVAHPFKHGRRSIGKALPGTELRMDEKGEIWVRGASVAAGYWQQSLGSLTDSEGWLKTGDVAEQDAGGQWYFRGRQKDVIVTAAGINIYPDDLEAVLNRQPEVRTCAVVGAEGPHGPEPLAVIIPSGEESGIPRAVQRANTALAPHQQIRHWAIWTERDFPRTSTQKVRKAELLKVVKPSPAATASQATTSATGADEVAVVGVLRQVSGQHQAPIGLDSRLDVDLKLDSLGRVELLNALEDRFQVDLDERAFTAATTVEEVVNMVRHPIHHPPADVPSASFPAATSDLPTAAEAPHAPLPEAGKTQEAAVGGSELAYSYPHWALTAPVAALRRVGLLLVILPLAGLLCRVRKSGRANLESLSAPALFVANHVTFLDPALILSALPWKVARKVAIAMEGERLRALRHPPETLSRWQRLAFRTAYFLLALLFNVFPLPQRSGFRRSFDYAGEAMDRGYHILVFPEGRRTEDGRMNEFRKGTGLLAQGLSVPVVPIRMEGLFELKQERARRSIRVPWATPGRVSVSFGRPISFDTRDRPEDITSQLQREVEELSAGGPAARR
ncbi:MAG: AMP-binding protein [Acidobacteriota bacterium]